MEFSINNTYREMVEGFEAEFSEFKSVDRLLSLSAEMKNNPFAKLALSRCFKNLRPSDERWVFMASDGYNLLDMRDEALSVLRRSHENGMKGNFLPRRVFNQYIHCFRFDEAVDFYRAAAAKTECNTSPSGKVPPCPIQNSASKNAPRSRSGNIKVLVSAR